MLDQPIQIVSPPGDKNFVTKESTYRTFILDILSWILLLVISFCSPLLINNYALGTVNILGESMYPTLETHQKFFMWKGLLREFNLTRGDIISLDATGDPTFNMNSEKTFWLMKRLIAVGGDKIGCTQGDLYVNGIKLEEKFVNGRWSCDVPNVTIPAGSVWVMGDNREISKDSRYAYKNSGKFFKESEVVGKIIKWY